MPGSRPYGLRGRMPDATYEFRISYDELRSLWSWELWRDDRVLATREGISSEADARQQIERIQAAPVFP
jgi:hypothetical protein